jgi:hypothetical protein
MYYREFEKILGKDLLVGLLKDIAIELQNQLDTNNVNFLNYWVTNRYFNVIDREFSMYEHNRAVFFRKYYKIGQDTLGNLKDYRARILQYLVLYQMNNWEIPKIELRN